ncbi:MAG: ComF family protein [Lachnospiraceae bacterium]|nr:ComF family protein [Lachnospiraceae bacterium]MBO5144560.1 ComF family protein [Lachnospiraceae bacterium]
MRDYERKPGLKEGILNILFPRRCPVCDDIVPVGEGSICSCCKAKPQYIQEPRCRRCGKQLSDDAAFLCGDCMRRKHVFDYGYALYDYQSMRKSIYRFKYKGRCEYAEFYAGDIAERLKDALELMGADSIVPVPVHASRLRSRGYNQSALIAAELSRLTGIPMYDRLVKRVKKTVPQKELNIQERQNNLKKAFHISSDVVKLNKTILVDDIYTTGSTLDAVALELKRHGAEAVYFITLCIGEGM